MKNSYSKAFRATLKGTTLATSRCTRQFSFKRHTLVVWGLLVGLWGYGQVTISANSVWNSTHQDRGWDGRGYSPGTYAVVVKAHGIDGKWYETKQTVSLLQ